MTNQVNMEALADACRTMARHESEQVHRRITWLASFQGFLFAALGVAWGKSRSLTHVFATLGVTVAALTLVGVVAAVWAIERIRQTWLAEKPAGYHGPDIMGFYPDRARFTRYTSGEILLPIAFMLAWIWVLIIA